MDTHHSQQFATVIARYQRPMVRIAFGVVVAAFIASSLWATGAASPRDGGPATLVAVRQGDTLWDLAVEHGPPDADPRRTVEEIRQANHLVGSLIHPGDMIRVPQQ